MSSDTLTIEMMNEVIARFMGDFKEKQMDAGMYVKYHKSWESLMAVWFRFIALRFKSPMNQLQHSELKTTIGYAILYGTKDLAHHNIYQGIQWYNQNKNQ